MGHRLSRIVTRTGDRGTTSLGSGLRVDKDSPSIEALGTVDELNSWIGILIEMARSGEVKTSLTRVQHDLFDLGAQLSVPGTPLMSKAHLARLDDAITTLNADLGPLKEFILPGGSQISAFSHIGRTVCRRAERCLITLSQIARQVGYSGLGEKSPEEANFGIAYLNRLSDLLFIVARHENRAAGREDVFWRRGSSVGSLPEGT